MECFICGISFGDFNECPVSCLNCGKIYCETCYDLESPECDNVIFGEATLRECSCGLYCREGDLSVCFVCNKDICLRCKDEAEFEDYCYDCIEFCGACGQETKYYYDKRYTCAECHQVYCEACLDEEGLCSGCKAI